MFTGRTIFSQILEFLPRYEFDKCVRRYRGNYRTRRFSCFNQFTSMAFAQLTGRESLRDIETCLRALQPKLYHLGLRTPVSRNTLAKANEKRDWRIYADLAQLLIAEARQLYAHENFGVDLDATAYALDATLIDLCLSLFPWARFRKRKGGIKLHTLLDLRGNIPCFIRVTDAKTYETHILDEIVFEPGSFYVMDRGYIDFARLYAIHQAGAFFVIRAKRKLDYRRSSSQPVDKSTNLRSDQTIKLQGRLSAKLYPECLRRVSVFDADQGQIILLTNSFPLPALSVTELYRCRWQVELFFKWIKQHLRIKAFFGTSPNAVKTQIWIAISVYVLVALIKKRLNVERSLYEILQILSITLFEKTPILEALQQQLPQIEKDDSCKQMTLFDF